MVTYEGKTVSGHKLKYGKFYLNIRWSFLLQGQSNTVTGCLEWLCHHIFGDIQNLCGPEQSAAGGPAVGRGLDWAISSGAFQETSLKHSAATYGGTQYDTVHETWLYLLFWAQWLDIGARLFRTGERSFILGWPVDICWKFLPVGEKESLLL